MMNRMIKLLLSMVLVTSCLISSLMLSACAENGMFRDRINDYKTVAECPSLQMPKGVSAESRSEDYYIPEKDGVSFRWFEKSASNKEQPMVKVPQGKMNTKALVLAPKKFENGELLKTNTGANTGSNTGSLMPKSFMGQASAIAESAESETKKH